MNSPYLEIPFLERKPFGELCAERWVARAGADAQRPGWGPLTLVGTQSWS